MNIHLVQNTETGNADNKFNSKQKNKFNKLVMLLNMSVVDSRHRFTVNINGNSVPVVTGL